MSRPARKPTLWPLRNVSTQIRPHSPRKLIRAETFRLGGLGNDSSENPHEAKRVYPSKPLLIWVDTLRIVHSVGFLAGRLMISRVRGQMLFTIQKLTKPLNGSHQSFLKPVGVREIWMLKKKLIGIIMKYSNLLQRFRQSCV